MVTTTETQLVTLTIDAQEVTVPAGTYILQAAEAAGVEVPNLCFQPLLRPWGSCRLCTVEIVGPRGGLIESCATPVRDGMEVLTQSERVVEARQFILQMYLIDHALDCPTCDKSGECYLQDNTYLHNVESNPYRRPKLAQPYIHHSDFIDYKWDRCIICARCTRVCHEMVGATAIEISNRGLEAEITPAYGIDLADTTCTNCGMCIAVCPVGALTDRHFGHHPWELDSVETICGMCDVGCTINAEYSRGIVRRTTHLWQRGVNYGYTCELGRWGHEHVQDPTRLWRAKIRQDGELREVGLQEAWDAATERLRSHQGNAFAALATPDNANEDNYVLQQFTRGVMASNSVDRLMPARQAAIDEAMLNSTGLVASSAGMQEMMTDSDVVLYVGPDPGKVAPIAAYWLYWAIRYRETRIVVVSPEHSPLAERSDRWLAAKPGTEHEVVAALAKVALDAGMLADDAETSWLDEIDIEDVVSRSGVDRDLLESCARLLAGGDATSPVTATTVWYSLQDQSLDNARLLASATQQFATTLDLVGRPGGGVLAIRGASNMQGSVDVGCHPDLFPGHVSTGDRAGAQAMASLWASRWSEDAGSPNGFIQETNVALDPGVGIAGLPDAIRSGRVKAMYISAQSHHRGEVKDSFFSASGEGYFAGRASQIWERPYDDDLLDALEHLDVLIVEDCFESKLTDRADIVLPAAMYLEKDGTFTNVDRTVQRLRLVVPPAGDSLATRDHIAQIASRLGYRIEVDNPSQLFDEIAMFVHDYQGISYPRLERGGVQWPSTGFSGEGSIRLTASRLAADSD